MLDRAGSRRSLSAEHAVVGVFGPTGSGKSSLVNALSGTETARVAVRRPTTSEPLALVWGREGSGALLDWLDVRQRVELPEGAPLVAGWASPETDVDDHERPTGHTGRDGFVPPGQPGEPGPLVASSATAVARSGKRGRGLFRRRRQGPILPTPDRPAAAPPAADAVPEAGLILLDLPDFDSTATAHREIVERLTGQVDVLLWVVDPQKYADAALHHGFLSGLAAHGAVTLVALNQADRLEPHDVATVTASLEGILAGEGLPEIDVVPVSARTGAGVPDLAAQIRSLAEGRAAAGRRLAADASRAATALLAFAPGEPVDAPPEAVFEALSRELGSAAGVPAVVDAVRSAYRRDAHTETGWPVTRWLARLRPDPLRRLNLRRQDVVPELRSSSVALTHPAQRAKVDHALRLFADAAASGVVDPWNSSIRDAARGTAGDLTDALDTAITGTELETGRRTWWGFFGILQWVAFAALVAGLAWLGVLAALGFLQLPVVDVPRFEGFPVPTLLIAGGLLSGVLLAVLAAVLARWGAARRAERVRRRLLAACRDVAHDVVLRPVEDEVERCNRFRKAVLSASTRP
ncbi:ABC transporter [Vibrio cholerae]|nr:ABC transporter [Vibrio cholerae]